MLKRIGYDSVVQAENGQEALTTLQDQADFGLLLTDWNMPIMNGLELVQSVRADERFKSLPILMITTRNMKQDIVNAMKAGVNNYITKPFQPNTLQEKISKVLIWLAN